MQILAMKESYGYPDPNQKFEVNIPPGYYVAKAYLEEERCEGSLSGSTAFYRVYIPGQKYRAYATGHTVQPRVGMMHTERWHYLVVAPRKFKVLQREGLRRKDGQFFINAKRIES